MSNYLNIEEKLHWNDLIPKIEPNICALYLRDKSNFILGWGKSNEFLSHDKFSFEDFQHFKNENQGRYIFGYFSYDLKNEIEPSLSSNNEDFVDFPLAHWFVPEHLVICINGKFSYHGSWDMPKFKSWIKTRSEIKTDSTTKINLKAHTVKTDYLNHLNTIKEHIQRGDIYETNYCINFYAHAENYNVLNGFEKLNSLTKAPFSVYMDFSYGTVLSASPERFVQKLKDQLISQPIKGTAARNASPEIDNKLRNTLENNPKERSENIMIVDLVRNDMSKLAKKDSVKVTELCKVYSFDTVHQLISTISCQLKENISDLEIIKALFPMGSMTGAPKISAMKIAEANEDFKRGLYAGSIGMFHPNGNFDFNVVIRSILYNKLKHVISTSVGGAITSKSNSENEYEECMTKLEGMKNALC